MAAGKPRCLAVIPARGGSKGLPRKNVLPFAGRPLIAWSVQAALDSTGVTRTIVSTDDQEILEAAVAAGAEAPFVRPAALASDEATAMDVVHHAMQWAETQGPWDYFVLLQPTSPLRTAADIDGCIELCRSRGAPAVVSVTPAPKSPYWMYGLDERGALSRLFEPPEQAARRQDLPPAYLPNGAVYVASWAHLAGGGGFYDGALGYVMPAERSVDIDSALDFLMAENLHRPGGA